MTTYCDSSIPQHIASAFILLLFLGSFSLLVMAALQVNSLSLHHGFGKLSPINVSKAAKHPAKHVQFGFSRGARSVALALNNAETEMPAPEEATVAEGPPRIDFEFIGAQTYPDGSLQVQKVSATGGEKLRRIMLDNDIDLYGPYKAFLLNCGGGGTCGTCLVEILEGQELLSERTDKEQHHLKKKPKTWRLACQATVGNEDTIGKVVMQRLPEWKSNKWRK